MPDIASHLSRFALLCVGNSMMGDDGAGPRLAEICAEYPLSGWTVVVFGALKPSGMVIVAGSPAVTSAVGRPFLGSTAVPVASSSGVMAEMMSTRNRSVSSPPTPRPAWPVRCSICLHRSSSIITRRSSAG